MAPSFYFIVFFVTLMSFVSGENFNVTNGAEDYFKASQLHLLHSIEIAEMKIASVDSSLASRLDVIHYEQHQVLHEIHQIHQNLLPLQSLSLVRKHCIQKFASKLVHRNHAKSELKICHDKAKLAIDSLTSKAKVLVNSAKKYVLSELGENVKNCSSSYNRKNETALEQCYIEYVDLATKTVGNYLRSTHDYLEKSIYDSSVISRNAGRCTYQVTSEVLKSLGASLKDIANCQNDFIEEITLKVNQKVDNQVTKDKSLDKIELNENAIIRDSENVIENENENVTFGEEQKYEEFES